MKATTVKIGTKAAVAAVATVAASTASAAGGATIGKSWIVFSASPRHGTQPAQLFRVRTDGSGLRQITAGARVATAPAFSPNGRKVVFARFGSGLFTVNVDGRALHRLTGSRYDAFPVWSNDGKKIAFLRGHAGELHLYVMNASGRAEHLLRRAPAPAGRPSWTRDGNIAIPVNGALYKVSSATGRVLTKLAVGLDPQSSVATPTLAPNGRAVAFVGPRPPPPDCQRAACEVFALYVKRLAGAQRLVFDAGPAGWSPDSHTLAFSRSGVLTLQPASGGTATAIPTGSYAIEGDAPPAWQPRA